LAEEGRYTPAVGGRSYHVINVKVVDEGEVKWNREVKSLSQSELATLTRLAEVYGRE